MKAAGKSAGDDRAARAEILRFYRDNRWLAHATLFPHRRPLELARAHRELVANIHAPDPRRVIEGFRGFAKSTHLEEAAVIRAIFEDFKFMVVVGASYDMACARLASIKREFEINDLILKLCGGPLRLKDGIWRENHIVLANGVSIMALGRDQSMTGIKFLDHRPDAALVDDVENPEEVRTDAEREQTWTWFLRTFLPALSDPTLSWVRVLGTRRGSGSLPERLEKAGWPIIKFPIEHTDETGGRAATWPAKFPLWKVDEMRQLYRGDMDTYMQEYMCQATAVSERPFRNIKIHARARAWEAVYAMYDPARTTGPKSATTGKAVWSWVRNRLIVWDAAAEFWLPDRLIADLFDMNEEYGPIWIGVEEDGLNEWLRQPLRHEQLRRSVLAPIKPLRAPRNKLAFIRGMQPYFEAGEVEFAKPLPALEDQLMGFPYGRIDAPNALAYALLMKPGAPLYDQFGPEHVSERLAFERHMPSWLACNATRGLVTAVLFQYRNGALAILSDWAIEDEPAQAVPLICRDVGMLIRSSPTACVGAEHYDQYNNVGLVQALKRVPLAVERGADPLRGRESLRAEFGRLVRSIPAVQVSTAAKHTLNALAGGYCRMLNRSAGIAEEAEPGLYRMLMEGLELCLGRAASVEADMGDGNWSETADGRRYRRYGHAQRTETERRV